MATRLQRRRHLANARTGVCHACGRHVPVTDLVTCEVEGLRGYDVCPYCFGEMRFKPSYDDLRAEFPIEVPQEEEDDLPRGADVFWR